MKYFKWLSFSFLIFLLISCSLDSMKPPTILVSQFTFAQDVEGWQSSYANYAPSIKDSFKFSFEYGKFVISTGDTLRAMVQSAFNYNSKLFMYVKRQIGGLTPNKTYSILFSLQLYSQLKEPYDGDLDTYSYGSYLKVGTFKNEPVNDTIADSSVPGGYTIVPGFDPCIGASDGADMIYIGKIEQTGVNQNPVLLVTPNTISEVLETADNNGKIWVVIGVNTNVPIYQSIYFSGVGLQFEEKQI